jgi:O-succinylbenzoate synthase
MKIDAIILRELHMPLVRSFETSFGVTRSRRILLVEINSEGLTGWGECTAGEHPFYSAESTDSAWAVIVNELAPMLAAESPLHGGECPRIFRKVRGNRMAKATLENAIWDMEAQREGISLSHLIGGVRDTISCGVSLGIQSSIPELMAIIEKELAAGYQRIKLKCKPDWDVEVFDKVRSRWPGIMLSCDANSAYRLRDADHLVSFDAFDLLMIEQPLWHDDFYYHSMLQKRLQTPICLDESIRNRRWPRSRWSRAGSSI